MPQKPPDYYQYHSPAIDEAVAALKRGDLNHIEPVLSFLERDPYTFGSGYVKEAIWRYLLRVPLTEKQQERLRGVALHSVKVRLSREFFPMCRLMSRLGTDKFRAQVHDLEARGHARVRHRAALLAAYLDSIRAGEKARADSHRNFYSRRFPL